MFSRITTSLPFVLAVVAVALFASACSSDDLALSGGDDVLVECYPDGVLVSSTENELASVEVEVDGRRISHSGVTGYQHAVEEEGIETVWVESASGDGFAGIEVEHACEQIEEGSLGDIPDALAFVDESGIDVECLPEGVRITTVDDEIDGVVATIAGANQEFSGLSGFEYTIDDPATTTVWVDSGGPGDYDGYALRHDCIRGVGIAAASD